MQKDNKISDIPELPEHFPTIIFDASSGAHLNFIDVDIQQITATLAQNDLTPEQIDDTTIIFSQEQNKHYSVEASGKYYPETELVKVFAKSIIQQQVARFEEAEGLEHDYLHESAGEYLGWKLDKTLRHELEHRIIHANGGMPEADKHERKTKIKLIGLTTASLFAWPTGANLAKEVSLPSQTIAEYCITPAASLILGAFANYHGGIKIVKKAYKNDPEEARAIAVEYDDQKTYITAKLKFQD